MFLASWMVGSLGCLCPGAGLPEGCLLLSPGSTWVGRVGMWGGGHAVKLREGYGGRSCALFIQRVVAMWGGQGRAAQIQCGDS